MDQQLKDLVWARATFRCEYCHFPAEHGFLPFQIDHIIAEKHHGPTDAGNLALACYYCNSFKGPNIAGIDPESGGIVPLFHPRRDAWASHFRWRDAQLIGLTPQARATIDVLRINDPEATALRKLVLELGEALE